MTDYWLACLQAAQLITLAPHQFGGVIVHARLGPVRERWLQILERLAQCKGLATPIRKIPGTISDENLLGGLDIESTITRGKPVFRPGLLSHCDQSLAILPMAERVDIGVAARLASALDHGSIQVERDGHSQTLSCAMGFIALDESIEDDESVNPKLAERCAFHIDLDAIAWRDLPNEKLDDELSNLDFAAIEKRFNHITLTDTQYQALVGIAQQLGIASLRAVQFAVRASRYLAALDDLWNNNEPAQEHLERAVSLVLLPRAMQMPDMSEEQHKNEAEEQQNDSDEKPNTENQEVDVLEDQVLEASKASIPAELLSRLTQLALGRQQRSSGGKTGISQKSFKRGRPMGSIAGNPSSGSRLSLIDTLRSAVPWQTIRRQQVGIHHPQKLRIVIRKEDFRVKRYRERNQTLTTFVVDASGSAAINRLAEAKGAVELLLAECYVRRDQVALISFRGTEAELLLSPTRSLVRAKRSLAALPGGGGTPLARAIDTAFALAKSAMQKGMTPTLVFLTDGRANIARDGSPGRSQAQLDAEQSAKSASQLKVRSLWIDTSPQAREEGEQIAALMGSYYLPLPQARAQELSQAVIGVLHS
jgi:magnesium chelatase subunit D